MNPFLDFRPPISASQGIEGNAFGPSPVSTYSRSTYNWGAGPGQAQAGGASIFPGKQACTDPNCAAPGDPNGLSAYSVNQNFRTPYFYHLNLQVEECYGNGDYDTRHLFTANITYLLPKAGWATGWTDKLVNGWQLSSLWVLHSGQPYDITREGKNLIGDPFAGVSHSFSKTIPGVQWINPAAFCTPGAAGCTGTANPNGNLARNKFVGPNYKSVDFSVLKNIPITE